MYFFYIMYENKPKINVMIKETAYLSSKWQYQCPENRLKFKILQLWKNSKRIKFCRDPKPETFVVVPVFGSCQMI